jgi:hypothetical protein
MIPQEVIDLTDGAFLSYVGSRDGNMMPLTRQCWGVDIKAAEDIIIYVVQTQFEPMLKNFQHNGRVTVSLTDPYSHASYQLKGQFLKARAMTEAETVLQQQYRDKLVDVGVIALGYSKEQAERYVYHANLAIEIEVEQIFNQTPGPAAGKEITA